MAKANSKSKSAAEPTAAPTPPGPAETVAEEGLAPSKNSVASPPETAPTVAPAASTAPATDAPQQYRENDETNKKIDDWIKRHPDQFKFFNDMPHERAVRKLILNEINRYERREYKRQQANGESNSPRQERGQGYGGGRRY